MEEKRLDFDRPLLSIRRPSSTPTSEPGNRTRSHDSAAPKMLTPPVYKSDIRSGPVRNPGTVPFQWEHKPGKPKDDNKSDSQVLEQQPRLVPKLPPGRTLNVRENGSGRKAETEVVVQTKHGNAAIAENARSSSRSEYDDCDGNEAYVDVIDTLSRSESFFLNCSVSGVSGLDGPNLHPFLSDPRTRDFMMGRFLPAAKALASETPPHLTRKPPLPKEQPWQIKKEVVPKINMKHTKTVQRHFLVQQQERWEDSGDEEEDDESVTRKSTMPGVCGLLPQICLKSSFGVLNPVPSMRAQAQRAVSVRSRPSNHPNSIRCHENENKHGNGARHEQRLSPRCQKTEMQEVKMKSNTEAKQSPCGRTAQKPNGSSAPQGEEAFAVATFISQEKEKAENYVHVSMDNPRTKTSKNFGELLASDDNRWEPCHDSPVSEKTLYVDTVHTVRSPKTDAKVQAEFESPSMEDLQVKDVQELSDITVDEPPVQEFSECRSRKENEHEQATVPLQGIDLEVQTQKSSSPSDESSNGYQQQLLPPPLPKAPSDSWLKRTLPTMPPSKNPSTWISLGNAETFSKIQAFHLQISPANPTWETMVKTSNSKQGLVQFSKEKLNPIPEA
ncbi:PREDICTED: uncharacterized protein LOC104815844 [Tarenaya hassleriana]|uniref:uncharacterized protein LOC104815844 n=1 Tax=Tarenaya hassleriana TaxID=28532 RepID=UPI00053C6320|nr:PREDICTED: uncharacterized protein LOC104815844 [Tarenaya hassleriana]XP_010542727.1 PREDICTED: uncharacterized protein LOC104815844 [Tarenaya hassleriana]XP_010542728.1 PREDICTED: uncharacterized protein LOC104815844 [Tarenaya hassleriana]